MYDRTKEYLRVKPNYYIDERCKSDIKSRPIWKNSQWKTLDHSEDASSNKITTSKLFEIKQNMKGLYFESTSTLQAPYNDESFTINSHTSSYIHIKNTRSPSVTKKIYNHFEENIGADFENLLTAKMKSFYK